MPANESGQENKMKKYVRLVVLAIIAVALITTVLGGFYRVDEQEAAVVTMFGKVVRTDTAGLYFKIPWVQIRRHTAPVSDTS